MKNRNLFLLTSGLAFPLLGAYAQKTPKPNIIYIMCDDCLLYTSPSPRDA